MAGSLPPGTLDLLRWLDARSGAALAWVNVDQRPQTRGPQVRRLVTAGLAEFRQEELGGELVRFMRITTMGRATAPAIQKKRTDADPA